MAKTLIEMHQLLTERYDWIQKQYSVIEKYEAKAENVKNEDKKLKLLDAVLAGYQSCSALMNQLNDASKILLEQADAGTFEGSKFECFDIIQLSTKELVNKYFKL